MALVCNVYYDFVTFSLGILGQVWYLIVSIPDPCCISLLNHLDYVHILARVLLLRHLPLGLRNRLISIRLGFQFYRIILSMNNLFSVLIFLKLACSAFGDLLEVN